jgi:hypothetical protein
MQEIAQQLPYAKGTNQSSGASPLLAAANQRNPHVTRTLKGKVFQRARKHQDVIDGELL